MIRRALRMLIAAAIAATPLAALAAGDAATPTTVNAGGATVVRQADDTASLVGIEFVVRAGLDRQTMRQNGLSALVAESILRTPAGTPPMPLEQAVAANGGAVRFTVDPDDVRFYVESLAVDAPAVLALVRSALSAPDFSPATVRDARAALVRQITEQQDGALQVGMDMLNAASAPQANTGLPSLGTPASLAQLVPADAAAFYRTYYRRGGSYVSAVGRLSAIDDATLQSFADALPEGNTSVVQAHVAPLKGSSREIIAHRDIASPWLIAQYPAPSVNSKDFGPMLVLAAFVKRTLADIAQVPGVVTTTFTSRAVGTVYNYDRQPPRLVLYVNGGIGNPSRAFATALSIVNVLAATKLEGSIDDFKAVAAGDFATGATTLESRAWLAAVFAQTGNSPDFLNRTLQEIAATTPDDVQRVARLYLGNPTIALVLPRDATPRN
ncbi:MAG: insulinase family protein [Candidatus Eremiobacteraeota bacterium]|nr:insulinase family protein [Candidatus Eremiobacteraeota bacterium]